MCIRKRLIDIELRPTGMGPPEAVPASAQYRPANGWMPNVDLAPARPVRTGADCCTRWLRQWTRWTQRSRNIVSTCSCTCSSYSCNSYFTNHFPFIYIEAMCKGRLDTGAIVGITLHITFTVFGSLFVFFQHKNRFDPTSEPALDSDEEEA